MESEVTNMEAINLMMDAAEIVFFDCKVNGFDKEKALAYNMLVSACTYLKTGDTLIGNRTLKFFGL